MTIITQMQQVSFAWALINFSIWVVTGLGLFKLASSRGTKTPFLVFLPFLRELIIGQMADEVCEYVDDPFEKFSNLKVGGTYAKTGIVYSLFFSIVCTLISPIGFLANNVVPLLNMVKFGILLAISYVVMCDYIENPAMATIVVGALGAGTASWILAFCGYKDMGTLYTGGSSGYRPQPTVSSRPAGRMPGGQGGMMTPPPAPPMPPAGGMQAGQVQGGFGVPGQPGMQAGQMGFNAPPRPAPPMPGGMPAGQFPGQVQAGFGVPGQVPGQSVMPSQGFVQGVPGQVMPGQGVPGQAPGVQGGSLPQQGLRK